jgi:hypothetical protein
MKPEVRCKQQIEVAARLADRDFDASLEAYLALYRPKVYQKPVVEVAEQATLYVIWLTAIVTWGVLLYLAVAP